MRIIFLLFFLISPSIQAEEYKFKCDKKVKFCEFSSKRVTIGDWIGVFDSEGYLVAVGEVLRLKGSMRVFQIQTKYGPILRSHRAKLITDEQAQRPQKFFDSYQVKSKNVMGLQLGLLTMGVGEGFAATNLEGYGQFEWRKNIYIAGRLGMLTGEGKASINDKVLETHDLKLTAFTLMGGIITYLAPQSSISGRLEFAVGLSNISASTTSGFSVKDVVDGRISSGTSFSFRGESALLFDLNGYFLMSAFQFLRLQNSNNAGFLFGVEFPL